MKPVVQLERTGCGIASVAAIAGLPYTKAKSIANDLGIYAEDSALWSNSTHVRRMLRHLGCSVSPREYPFRSWVSLPDLALLSIKWHIERGCPYWHWVVFVREGDDAYVLDSKKGLRKNRRTDFWRIKPKWFIPVTQERVHGSAGTRH
jgi:ABC-type bacteriocin/lantibiotic exporter with double-glycine peptidase domain